MPKHHIFLSYSREDQRVADAVVEACGKVGLSVWYDRMIPPNRDWAATIVENIECSDMLIILFSEYSNDSTQLARELAVADARGMVVYPVFIEDVRPRGSYAFRLATEQRFTMYPNSLTKVDALAADLRRHLFAAEAVAAVEAIRKPGREPLGRKEDSTGFASQTLPDGLKIDFSRGGAGYAAASIAMILIAIVIAHSGSVFSADLRQNLPIGLIYLGCTSLAPYAIVSVLSEAKWSMILKRDGFFFVAGLISVLFTWSASASRNFTEFWAELLRWDAFLDIFKAFLLALACIWFARVVIFAAKDLWSKHRP